MKRVAILQSNYIPWKGYFDIIRQVDLFIFHDDLQYTKNDWRNRNKIKTPRGAEWLSIPCGSNEKRLINEVRVDANPWQEKHFRLIEQNYRKAPFWDMYAPFLKDTYLARTWTHLSELNQHLIVHISKQFLGCETQFGHSENYSLTASKEDRVLQLLERAQATHYLSGPAGQNYLTRSRFEDIGITLDYIDYSCYPDYRQFHPPFVHGVTIFDLLLQEGPEALAFMLPTASDTTD